MIRGCARFRTFVAALAVGLAWGGSVAGATDPEEIGIHPGRAVHSNTETASSGRRPLAVRIAMADGAQSSNAKADEPSDTSPPEQSVVAAKESADEASPDRPVDRSLAPSAAPSPGPSPDRPADRPADTDNTSGPDRQKLLTRVKQRIASIGETARSHPMRKPAIPRLIVDCEESAVEARQGDSITWRITIRNVGGPAHGVHATLYFAEGIEPLAASDKTAKLAPGEVRFGTVGMLVADEPLEFEVTGKAIQAGAVAYRVEVGCLEVPGNAARESVIVVR